MFWVIQETFGFKRWIHLSYSVTTTGISQTKDTPIMRLSRVLQEAEKANHYFKGRLVDVVALANQAHKQWNPNFGKCYANLFIWQFIGSMLHIPMAGCVWKSLKGLASKTQSCLFCYKNHHYSVQEYYSLERTPSAGCTRSFSDLISVERANQTIERHRCYLFPALEFP